MLRRIATVALILGSAAALLIGSSTYAPFMDEATGSGDVEAGSVNVRINDQDVYSFDTSECRNMAPGHPCVLPLNVSAGTSTLSATWETTVTDTDDPELDCFAQEYDVPAGDEEEGDPDADHDPDDVHEGTLTVTVLDKNECQSATSTVTVSVVATQSPSPHN